MPRHQRAWGEAAVVFAGSVGAAIVGDILFEAPSWRRYSTVGVSAALLIGLGVSLLGIVRRERGPGWLYGTAVALAWQAVPLAFVAGGLTGPPALRALALTGVVAALVVVPVLAGAIHRSRGVALVTLALGVAITAGSLPANYLLGR